MHLRQQCVPSTTQLRQRAGWQSRLREMHARWVAAADGWYLDGAGAVGPNLMQKQNSPMGIISPIWREIDLRVGTCWTLDSELALLQVFSMKLARPHKHLQRPPLPNCNTEIFVRVLKEMMWRAVQSKPWEIAGINSPLLCAVELHSSYGLMPYGTHKLAF